MACASFSSFSVILFVDNVPTLLVKILTKIIKKIIETVVYFIHLLLTATHDYLHRLFFLRLTAHAFSKFLHTALIFFGDFDLPPLMEPIYALTSAVGVIFILFLSKLF